MLKFCFCFALFVDFQAWAPFGDGRGGMFELPAIKTIGDKYGNRKFISLQIAVVKAGGNLLK